MAVNWEGIPSEVRGKKLWCCWRKELPPGATKETKVPYCCWDGGRHAKTTDPATWSTYEQAQEACVMFPDSFDGPGLILKEGLLGIDLDKCRDAETGEVDAWAWDIVHRLKSYSEFSPSGTGIKILIYAKMESLLARLSGVATLSDLRNRIAFKGGVVEIYDHNSPRYFTITGRRVPGTPETIELRQDEFESIYREVFAETIAGARDFGVRRKKAAVAFAESNPHGLTPEMEEVLSAARAATNSEKFNALWKGNWETICKVDGTPKYPSQSEADMALIQMLLFYYGPDAEEEVAECFRCSGLYREQKDRPTYLQQSVRRGVTRTIINNEWFCWDYRREAARTEEQSKVVMEICKARGLVPTIPERAPEPEAVEEPQKPAAVAGFDLDRYKDEPLFSWLWRGNHGLLVTDEERLSRIRSIERSLKLVPDRGFFRKYLEVFTRASDMNVIYNIAGALSLAGHVMNRKVYTWLGNGRYSCHSWIGLIGPSTTGRKSQALGNTRAVLNLDPDYHDTVAPGQFSLQSLFDAMGVAIPKPGKGKVKTPDYEIVKEMRLKMKQVEEGMIEEYTVGVVAFHADEIASLIDEIQRPSNAGAKSNLMTWFDCADAPCVSRFRTTDNSIVVRPCPTILGCSTPDNLSSRLCRTDLESGFLNRWVLFPSFTDERDLTLSCQDAVRQTDVEVLQPFLDHFKACRGERTPTVEAMRYYDGWYRDKISKNNDELNSWKNRLLNSAWKFAMIFQADSDPDPFCPYIDEDSVQQAALLVDEIMRRLEQMWPDFAFTDDDRNSTRVYRLIDAAGENGIEHTPLFAQLKGKASSWKPYIDSLSEQGRIIVGARDTPTKNATVYVSRRNFGG